ncbi:hypothetical protein [Solilutibacter silvestris]|uniref:hypothetical protein n=1 Tax=Solilutibacter silvestris TaxID=1645665 RepID=UPI003D33D069
MLLSLIIAAKIASSQPPKEFPKFDRKTAQPIVLKATLEAGAYLPESPECSRPIDKDGKLGFICMDPPPFWVSAKRLLPVYGDLDANSILLFTTSHYGMERIIDSPQAKPRLLLVLRHGDDYVMPRYAQAIVLTSRSGEDFIPYSDSMPIWWLPCSVADLRIPLDPQDFPSQGWSDFYSVKAFPKFGIPLKKISEQLARLKPSAAQITCGHEI